MKKIILWMLFLIGVVGSLLGVERRVEAADYLVNNPTTDSTGKTTWDCVLFGNYWQSNEEEKEPIKWRVLSVDGDDAFLWADKNLDYRSYNDELVAVTWETSSLRKWLNEFFLNEAFSEAEKASILEQTVINSDNPIYQTPGGNQTVDKVYLLSYDEVINPLYGFQKDPSGITNTRVGFNTKHTSNQGGSEYSIVWEDVMTSGDDYWLRTPGQDNTYASGVCNIGAVKPKGATVADLVETYDLGNGWVQTITYSGKKAVRPCLHINLSQNQWVKADSVSATGGTVPTVTPTPPPPTSHRTVTRTQRKVEIVVLKMLKKVKKRTVLIKWKQVKNVSGYQIQFSTTKKFKKMTSKETVKTNIKIKKLKKKTYYFRVRAYKNTANKRLYGKWSKVKKVKLRE